ncbi:hypothetical protein [Streptomyces sp. NPDC089919]|uniref:hypothetical protein n=1 Tax=Streptomyces sp. NPDC089919 TaxID=3155188 RepID=UPI00344954CB
MPTRRLKRVAAAAVLTAVTALPFTLATAAAANDRDDRWESDDGGRYDHGDHGSGHPSGTVSPSSVAPGGSVRLRLENCGSSTGTATSTAFGTVTLTPGNPPPYATVFRTITPGSHPVTFQCGGRSTTAPLTVAAGPARGGLGGSVGQISPGQIAMGGALVAGALGTGVWILRRRGSTNPTA